ncbi:MAG: CopG family transcriptional regulator [Bacillota bacterium]
MIRKQIYLEKTMIEQIKKIAKEKNVSQSEVIRESLTDYIRKQQLNGEIRDPLLKLIGIFDTKSNSGSVNHDDSIYGGSPHE